MLHCAGFQFLKMKLVCAGFLFLKAKLTKKANNNKPKTATISSQKTSLKPSYLN